MSDKMYKLRNRLRELTYDEQQLERRIEEEKTRRKKLLSHGNSVEDIDRHIRGLEEDLSRKKIERNSCEKKIESAQREYETERREKKRKEKIEFERRASTQKPYFLEKLPPLWQIVVPYIFSAIHIIAAIQTKGDWGGSVLAHIAIIWTFVQSLLPPVFSHIVGVIALAIFLWINGIFFILGIVVILVFLILLWFDIF